MREMRVNHRIKDNEWILQLPSEVMLRFEAHTLKGFGELLSRLLAALFLVLLYARQDPTAFGRLRQKSENKHFPR